VEDYMACLVDAVVAFAKSKGYTVDTSFYHIPDMGTTDERQVVLHFSLTTTLGITDANIIVSINGLSGKPKIHSAKGFPKEFESLLHDLSTSKDGRKNSAGVQAVRKNNPAQSVGGSGLAEESYEEPTPSSNYQISQAVVALIDIATINEEAAKNERTRQYIGASGIAEECLAYHQLSMRGFPSDTPKPKMIRIFNEGHRIEPFVVKMLSASGHRVEPVDPITGEQWEYTSHGGHHVCHLDGFITLFGDTERMTLEVKSMNRKMFDNFVKKGVQLSHHHYYEQCVDGLMLARDSGVKVNKCVFIAYCKDNSEFHVEIIQYESKVVKKILEKLEKIVINGLSERKHKSSYEYDCKQCFKQTSCWKPNLTTQTCQQCAFAHPNLEMMSGKGWICEINQKEPTGLCPSFALFRPSAKP
jgi:hypothetical protein